MSHPLRLKTTGRETPGWYSWVIVILMTILLSGGAMALAVSSSGKAVRTERAAREEADRQQEELRVKQEELRVDQLRVTCTVIDAQVEAYRDPPPVTAAGKNAAAAWRKLHQTLNCE